MDRTTRRATPANRGTFNNADEAANERNVVARPSARKRRPWSCKILGVMGLLAAATIFAPSCAVSGSDMPDRTAVDSQVRQLSPATIEALRKDTGVNPVYVLVVPTESPVVIGVPPNGKITTFDKEQDLWAGQGKVSVRSVKPAAFVHFQRNPEVYCFSYTAFGSLRWYCVEFPE
jgi:hypothetical protein